MSVEALEKPVNPNAPGTARGSDLFRSVEAAIKLRGYLKNLLQADNDPHGELSADNAVVLQDTFEGETTLDTEIRNAVLLIDEDEMLIAGVAGRIAELSARKSRFEKRIDDTRGLIARAMVTAEWPKFQMDIGTVSVKVAKARVEIDDESVIPSQFYSVPEPCLNKKSVTAVMLERHYALEAAKAISDEAAQAVEVARVETQMPAVPGTHIEIGGVTLAIRRK